MLIVNRSRRSGLVFFAAFLILAGPAAISALAAQDEKPMKVYVPYEQLKDVFGTAKEGVFLPKDEFQKLWDAAHKSPADVGRPPLPFLISAARFTGCISGNLAEMHMELTVDILADGWVEVPIALGGGAINKVTIKSAGEKDAGKDIPEMLMVSGDGYNLLTKGTGRRVIDVDFVRQLEVSPGLQVLKFMLPKAAISTLELLIPEENMKVDLSSCLAATTSQVEVDGKKNTKIQAFLSTAEYLTLSWKPSTQTAESLTPVVICNQLQVINVDEALVTYKADFDYEVLRRGVDSFTIQLPADFRVINVNGANIAKWNLTKVKNAQSLSVSLFSPALGNYHLSVEMERFLKQDKEEINLTPAVTLNVLRRTGLIALTHSPRRSVEMLKTHNLARVDVGRLPQHLQQKAVAYRFITPDYSGVLNIATVEPRISVRQSWWIAVMDDAATLDGRLWYDVKKIGVFQLKMKFPEPWTIKDVTPSAVVENYELTGKGKDRELKILLRAERMGKFAISIAAEQKRTEPTAPLDFILPLPDAKNLENCDGTAILALSNRFRAEVDAMQQFQPLPVEQAGNWATTSMIPAMAFSFQSIDRAKPAELKFSIIAKPTQVQAAVYRLVNIQPGGISQTTVVDYNIMYAPIDTLYLKIPATMVDDSLQITGQNMKEWPQLEKLPAEVETPSTQPGIKWAYYKIVLQMPVTGHYRLNINTRKPFSPSDKPQTIDVLPILAAGKISDQQGFIVVAKDETLAIVQPEAKNLIPADPGSEADIPYAPFRNVGSMAYKYTLGAKADDIFSLSLSVVLQKAAPVITTMATACAVEQALGRDGTLNSHATLIIKTRHGDRLPFTLPKGAKLFGVMLNGAEAPVESTADPDVRILRLPPSSGQVKQFTVEITYSQTYAKPSRLNAPTLSADVPVQVTLWRIWMPQENALLKYDRDFAPVTSYMMENLVAQAGMSPQRALTLPASGKQYNFFRQGDGSTLRLWSVRKEIFYAVVWAVIIIAGVVMLKFCGFTRCIIIVAVLLAGAITSLYLPLLARFMVGRESLAAAALVLLLWIAQWIFAWSRKPRMKTSPVIAAVQNVKPEASTEESNNDADKAQE